MTDPTPEKPRMTSKLTVDGPCRRTLAFEVDRTEMDREIEEGLRELAKRANFKGFRQGRAPMSLVRRVYGDELREDVRRRVMQDALRHAIDEHGLQPVGNPELNLSMLEDEGDGPFTFEMALEVAPEFELELDDLAVTIELPPFDESMVENELMRLRHQAGRLEDAGDDVAIDENSFLRATIAITVDGETLPEREDRPVLPARGIVDDLSIEAAAEALADRKLGDAVELPAVLPEHFEPSEHAGREATVRLTVTGHKTIVPAEVDEAFLERTGCASEQELRDRLRAQIEAQRAQAREDRVDSALQRMLVDRTAMELPERMAARAIDERVHRYAHQLIEQGGQSPEAGHQAAEQQREALAESTRRGLKSSFILARVASEQGLHPTEAEVEQQIRTLAQAQGQDADKLLELARTEGWFGDVAAQVTEQKARAWLRERAEVTEAAPSPTPSQEPT